jgi:hypothetical protein
LKTFLFIICIIAGIYIIFRIKKSISKHNAAMNALVAKATYQQLDIVLQRQVIDRVLFILQRDGGFPPSQESLNKIGEKAKYIFYALAMLELGIEPISRKWKWYPIRNPFVALIGSDKEIKMAELGLKKEGIDASFSD